MIAIFIGDDVCDSAGGLISFACLVGVYASDRSFKAAVVREFLEELESWGDVSFSRRAILPKGDLGGLLILNLFFGFMFSRDG